MAFQGFAAVKGYKFDIFFVQYCSMCYVLVSVGWGGGVTPMATLRVTAIFFFLLLALPG